MEIWHPKVGGHDVAIIVMFTKSCLLNKTFGSSLQTLESVHTLPFGRVSFQIRSYSLRNRLLYKLRPIQYGDVSKYTKDNLVQENLVGYGHRSGDPWPS